MPITLDDAGLHILNQAQIAEEMAQAVKTATTSDGMTLAFGPNWLTSLDSVDGQMINTIAEQLAGLHQVAQDLCASIGIGGKGKVLESMLTIAGTPRKGKAFSTVVATLGANAGGATVPKNTIVKTSDTGVQFVVSVETVVPPSGTAPVVCAALEAGPVLAAAGTLTVIGTPVAGLVSCTNAADAVPGVLVEQDEDYRARHTQSVAGAGVQILDAILAAVLEVAGVTSCQVYENDTDLVDGDGILPHSVWVVVEGGADQAIINAIGVPKGGGARCYGATSGTWTDSQGHPHTIAFTRVSAVDWWIKLTCTPAASVAQHAALKAAMVAYVNGLGPGVAPNALSMSKVVSETVPTLTAVSFSVSTVAPSPGYNGITPTPSKAQRLRTETAKIAVV